MRSRTAGMAPRMVHAVLAALAASLLVGCGGPAPSASSTPSTGTAANAANQAPASPRRTATASAALGAATAPAIHGEFKAAGFSCIDCHPCGGITTGHGPEWMVRTSPAFHALAANRNLADCQTCHGMNLDGAGGSTVVGCQKCHGESWRTRCTMCHGGQDNPTGAPPKLTWGMTEPVRAGAHTAHVGGSASSQAFGCEVCHVVPSDALSPGHVNGPIATVTFGGLSVQGGLTPAWDRANPTCAGTYCHGGFTNGNAQNAPDWTKVGQGQAACGTCHAIPPGGTHPSVPADATGCAMCHEDSVDAAGKVKPVPAGKHLDGALQVSGGHPTDWMAPVSPGFHATSANRGLGACQACHGQDLSGGFTGISCANCHGPTWATTCTMCHGGIFEPSGAPPKATWSHTGDDVAIGAHTAHVKASARADAIDCAVCHVKPASAFASGHIDGGFAGVRFDGLATQGGLTPPAWNRASPTCGTTYCHGNFTNGKPQNAPDWTKVGEGQASCGTCHGAPPAGTHPAVGSALSGCATCHPDSVDTAGNVRPAHLGGKHLDGAIDVKASHDASWMAWGSPTHHAASANLSLVACQVCHGQDLAGGFTGISCAQCHGATWKTSCTMCHGGTENASSAPPRATYLNTADPIRVGAHTVHVDGPAGGQGYACEVCHVVPADALSPGHIDGPIATVTFGGVAKQGGLEPTFDRASATCATTYCHGGTLKGGTHVSPDWTKTADTETACGSCHGVPPPAPHPAVGSDLAGCSTCHPSSVNTAGGLMRPPVGLHLDGKVDFQNVHGPEWMDQANSAFHAAAANRGLAGCQSCHGADLQGGNTAVSCAQCHGATWKTKCTMCHGGTANLTGAPPKSTWGNSADPLRVGAHTAHVAGSPRAQAYDCIVCHVKPADALAAGHLGNGPAEVNLGLGWNRATGTCASASCHGTAAMGGTNHAPVWTTTGTAACGSCHGLPPAGAHPLVSSDLTGCVMCHGDSVTSTGAVKPVPSGMHLDGKMDHNEIHGPAWRDTASPGFHAISANASLSGCQTCHGPALDGGTAGVACAQCHTATWRTDCTMCHGTQGVTAAPPRTTWGNSADVVRAGAHAAHLGDGLFTQGFACQVCHPVPADALSPGHVGGPFADVTFGGIAAQGVVPPPVWDRTTPTCASTYCHGNFQSGNGLNAPNWTLTGQGQGACGTCHGLPPSSPHPQNPACENCHAGYTRTSVNLATHVDGAVEVLPLTCTSCHGSAQNAAPPYGTRGELLATDAAVGAHQAHLAGGTLGPAVACTDCHLVPTSMTHANGTADVAFGPRAYTNGGQPSWDAGSLTCAGTYCHGATLRGGGTNTAPLWTGGSSQVACGSCHGTPPPQPHPHTAICDNCHPGYTLTSVNLATHMNGVIDAVELTCSSCHGDDTRVLTMGADPNAIAAPPFGSRGETATTSRSVGQHQAHVSGGHELSLPSKCRYCHVVPTTTDHWNGISQATFGSLATMGGAQPTFDGNTCANTYCHGATLGRGGTDHNPRWTNPDPVTCTSCHGIPPPLPHPQDSDCIRCHPGYTSTSVRKWTHVNGISDFPSGCNSCHDDPPNTGAHYDHLQEHITCDKCHQGYTATSANPVLHRNAKQDVTLNGWDPVRRTCNNVGCHGSEYWGRNGTAAAQSCNQCHGVPPDSGEHREHTEYACSRCHGAGYSKTTTGPTHMSGVVDVPYAFYDRATLTCGRGTGSCHGSEHWGQRKPVTANCGNCHGFPPPLPHPQQTACQSCHPSMNANGTLTADHNNGTLDISGTGCQACHGFPPTVTRSGGTHPSDANCYGCHPTTVNAQNENVPNGTHNDGSVQVGGSGVGTYGCQTCHGDQARAIDATMDPSAKAAPPLGTRGETEPTTRAVGAHLAHLTQTTGALSEPAACAECHLVPTAMDHANGEVVNVFGGRATLQGAQPRFELTDFTCSSTYCHGATLGAGGTNHTPAWNGGAAEAACGTCHGTPPPDPHPQNASCGGCHDGYTSSTVNVATHVDGTLQVSAMVCNSCHGSALNAAPPSGTRGESLTTTLAVGAHQQHLAAGGVSNPIACSECHIPPASMSHKDGTAQVTFGTLAATGGALPAWNRSTASCSASYCHGQFPGGNTFNAPVWTVVNGTQAACGTCHGAPPPPPHDPSTNCAACHPGYTATSVDLAQHLNGRVDVTMSCTSCHGDPPALPHSQSTGCGSCHAGYTNGSVNVATHRNGTVDVVPMTCTSCHGDVNRVGISGADANVKAAPPIDATGDTAVSARGVGAHLGHVNQAGFRTSPIACSECHFNAVPAAGDTSHVNGSVAFAFGPLAKNASWGGVTPNPTWDGTTCANTYCHGAFKNGANASIAWAQDVTLSCTSCHGSPPGGGHPANTSCGSCHTGYTATSVNKATHVNGALDVIAMTCTSCHGKAGQTATAAAPLNAAPPVDTLAASTGLRVGAHQKHLVGGNYSNAMACQTCHASVGTYATTHGNGTNDVGFTGAANANLRAGTYTPRNGTTAVTCSNTWCHAVKSRSGTTSGGTALTPSWTASITACTACHGNPPSTGRHTSVSSHRVGCSQCHSGYSSSTPGTTVNKTLHVNGARDVGGSGTKINSWSTSSGSCSPTCHGSKTW